VLTTWKVAAHKENIKIGDKVILWLTGAKAGCYALAQVTSAVGKIGNNPEEIGYYKTDYDVQEDRVNIEIEKNFFSSPILWKDLKDHPVFSNFKGGNQGTNFIATELEYKALLNMSDNNYSWVKTHKELSQYLIDKESQQRELITLLESAGATLFNDQNPQGTPIKLAEIDPFTFYCYIYKYGPETRLEILQNIAKSLNLFVPTDELGVPSTNPQKVWLFTYKYERNNNEIKRLWNFFYAALNNNITEELFSDILEIKGVASTKLTEALFYVDPENYFPINGPTKPYLEEVLGIDPEFNSYAEYKNILKQIKIIINKPFYQLSYEAWIWNNDISREEKDFRSRVKQSEIKSLQIFFQYLDNLIDDLEIENNEKLVFSTGSNQLSFQIGKRYCLNLKKDKFYFIAPENYEIDKVEKELFAKPDVALWYKNVSNDEVSKHYKAILEAVQFEIERDNSTNDKEYDNKVFRRTVFDKEYRATFFDFDKTKNIKMKLNEIPLNQILFGPPGTGKTFNSINEALKIVDPDYYNQYATDREKLNKRFKELLIKDAEENSGQIGFCTFHQSFGYEDFVEGIKPKTTPNQTIVYKIEDGVFKNICRLATMNNSVQKMKKDKKISWNEEQFRKASFYKLSLGDSSNPSDNNIYEFCRDKGYICIGFGQDNDFKGLSESEINAKCKDLQLESTAASQMNYFIHYLKKNNYVLISFGNRYIRALGKVIGDYEYWAESPIRYNHFRKVEWLFVDEMIPINEIYERGLSQKTMYKIDESVLRKEFFVKDGTTIMEVKEEDKNFVLIIDEINRGNVSSIFGELITLIEKDKREGAKEELEVVLPYSKKPFKVPQNVYIIGTMNTADRSVEALDTALRRRFSFKEFPPQSHLIQTEGVSGEHEGIIDDISLVALLDTLNNRIEKLIDKDHRIGHSYFLKVDSKEKLIAAFKNEIIPLLEEYFFGDYGKIGLILGSTFVEKKPNDFAFAHFSDYDTDIQSDLKEKAIYRIKDSSDWDFTKI
jgi:5-methylcytosine-specific restriction protein B